MGRCHHGDIQRRLNEKNERIGRLCRPDMRKGAHQMNKTMELDRMFDIRNRHQQRPRRAGNLGSPKRMDYSDRGGEHGIELEKIAQPNQILIGEATYNAVKGPFPIQKLGKKTVKGKTRAVTVYEVLDD
jgi:adenylate cyclase